MFDVPALIAVFFLFCSLWDREVFLGTLVLLALVGIAGGIFITAVS